MSKPADKSKLPPAPLNLRIAPGLKKRFKLWCVDRDIEMTEAVTYWIGLAVEGKLSPPPADAKPRKR